MIVSKSTIADQPHTAQHERILVQAIYQMLILFVIALDQSQLERTVMRYDGSNVTLTQVTGAVSTPESTEWGSRCTTQASVSGKFGHKRPGVG